jgi:predicted RNA-binding protein associated with RNAse of E/G family
LLAGRVSRLHIPLCSARARADGQLVLSAGFQITYFELIGQWFTIGKIRDLRGRHTGYYCDIATPPIVLADTEVEQTDLFLDLWVFPDLRYEVFDERELEDALRKGWIEKELYEAAKSELKRLIENVQEGRFPPRSVKLLEKKMSL